jgi:hypothetical protein
MRRPIEIGGDLSGFGLAPLLRSPHTVIMVHFESKVIFDPVEMKIGKGWYILATPPKGTPVQLGGFKTEDEAREWIKRKSIPWLKEFEGGKYA